MKILIGQKWKSNYADITYKILGGGINGKIEMYDIENIWDCKTINEIQLKKHFHLEQKKGC
tara:strand:+ start:120 stop:302 length:183 start_codon:yes stop_codon:yes gene_type:complete